MAHARKQLRDAVVALLTGLPTAGNQVSGNKFYTLPKSVNAALHVYPESERTSVPDSSKIKERSLMLAVEAVVRAGASTIEDKLDVACAEIETALDGVSVISGAAVAGIVGTEMSFEEGNKIIGKAKMTFQLDYATREGLPEVIL